MVLRELKMEMSNGCERLLTDLIGVLAKHLEVFIPRLLLLAGGGPNLEIRTLEV
jgi:hypothetical protein